MSQSLMFEKEIKDEKGNFYLMRVLPYDTAVGKTDGVVLTFIPINELKKANENLEKIGELYRAVYDNSYDKIILLNKEGNVNSSNASFANFTKEGMVGKSILEIFPQDYRDVLAKAMKNVFGGDSSSFFQFESEGTKSNKEYFSASVNPVIIKSNIYCLALITRNITELKRKELELREMSISLEKQVLDRSTELENRNQELSEMNSYLDSFVHGAAHDLRAPITQVKGMMQLLPKIDKIEKKESLFKEVANCVTRLEKTLNGLIEMIDFQKNDIRVYQEISLLESFKDVKSQLQKDILDANATVKVSIPSDLKINFIEAYITSIFYNLMSNAIKYRSYSKNLTIDIEAKHEEEFLVITIADNGIGIDSNRYGHFLFQPFKRLTLQREGTGIGLSIINNVVTRYGGRIEVDSKLDMGTTFRVFIKPQAQEDQIKPHAQEG